MGCCRRGSLWKRLTLTLILVLLSGLVVFNYTLVVRSMRSVRSLVPGIRSDSSVVTILRSNDLDLHSTSDLDLGYDDDLDNELGALRPFDVVYMWCGQKPFTFRNFLSMKSVLKFLKPGRITFAYEQIPPLDKYRYNTWLEDIEQSYPFLEKVLLPESNCKNSDIVRKAVIDDYMEKFTHGAIFVGIETIFVQPLRNPNVTITDTLSDDLTSGYCFFPQHSVESSAPKRMTIDQQLLCKSVPADYDGSLDSQCYSFTQEVFPYDFIYRDSEMGRSIRVIMYGKSEVVKPRRSGKTKVPNIGHMIWLGNKSLKIDLFISVLSALYIGNLDRVYIHGNNPPTGEYWDRLMARHGERVHYVPRPLYTEIFGQKVSELAHSADLLKIDTLVKFGGILIDPDMMFIQRIDPDLYSYEFVIGLDHMQYAPYPEVLNIGIVLSQPGSRFARLWQQSQRDFRDEEWLWNSGLLPYKIWEREPSLALISRELQVMCFRFNCHPTWLPRKRYQNVTALSSATDARDLVARGMVLHITWPEPFVSLRQVTMETGGIFGRTARAALRAAGELGAHEGKVP